MARRDNRTLRVDIDGDPKGFDLATKQAQAAAGAFDRELEKLERTERKQQAQTERNAAAMRRLEKAQKEAADAAGRLERGEIDAAEAARLQERAENQLNKVLMAQAAASAAAARAANELAEEQRQAARAAELAAAKQRLAQLKAAGAVEEHNTLVRQLRTRFPDLGDAGGSAFTEIGSAAQKSSVAMRALSSGGLPAVAAGLAALPWLGTLAGSAITLGVGGALIGIGVLGASQSEKVKKAFTGLRKHVVTESKEMSKPFEDTLVKTAGFFEDAFDDLAPTLRESLDELAPIATNFAHSFADSLTEFGPAIEDVTDALGPLLGELGDDLPGLMGRIADAIARIARSADPQMFGRFIEGIGLLITYGGHLISVLTKVADVFTRFGPIAIAARNIDDFGRGLDKLVHGAGIGEQALDGFNGSVTSFRLGSGLAAASTSFLGSSTATASGQFTMWAGTMRLASQTANQLKASLDALSGKTLTLREATSAYEGAIDAATDSIKENGRAHGFATEKGRANEAALNQIVTTAHNEAVAMRDSGRSAAEVAQRMETARQKFIATAIKMGYSRDEAKKLADKLYGVRDAANSIPKGHQTKITTPGIGNAIKASKDMRQAVLNVPTSRTITYYVRNQGNAIRASKAMYRGGYIDGYAGGGEIQGYPAGGMIGGVGGPTSDSNLIAASKGEFMVNAASTKEFRPLLEAINSGRWTPKSMTYGPAMTHRPVAASSGARPVVEFRFSDRRTADVLIDLLRPAISTRGGVEVVFK